VQLVQRADGKLAETRPPTTLPDNRATVLDVYGNLSYAGARTLEQLLPGARGTRNSVVILRLRGRSSLGATLIEVLAKYSGELRAANGRLYLSGLSKRAQTRIEQSQRLRLTGPVHAYEATSLLGESTRRAMQDADAWLVSQTQDEV
jgi:SulP family sulfate permease